LTDVHIERIKINPVNMLKEIYREEYYEERKKGDW
jgi:hypothetical protein